MPFITFIHCSLGLFKKLNISLSFFFYSMDKNGMITIGSQDWSNYPMVEKTENIPEIILYWKHSTVSSAVCIETTKFAQKGTAEPVQWSPFSLKSLVSIRSEFEHLEMTIKCYCRYCIPFQISCLRSDNGVMAPDNAITLSQANQSALGVVILSSEKKTGQLKNKFPGRFHQHVRQQLGSIRV